MVVEERMASLSTSEQQQFLEGLALSLDAIHRYASLGRLTPLEREEFISNAFSQFYSNMRHNELDPSELEKLIETRGTSTAESCKIVAILQESMGLQLDLDQKLYLNNVLMEASNPCA
ncbi:MAG: hypothetical protein WC494_01035 [Candidatus Pacearchaeota archaeon]